MSGSLRTRPRTRFPGCPALCLLFVGAACGPIAPGPDASHAICGTPEVHGPASPTAFLRQGLGSFSALTEDAGPSEIDLLVAYTEDARILAGSVEAIVAEIQETVDEMNAVFERSGVHAVVRLVDTLEVSYVQTDDFNQDLDRLADPADGYMDEVHAARFLAAADLVSLVVAAPYGTVLGNAQVLVDFSPSAWFERAFSLVAFESMRTDLTLAHEIGHNLGCGHESFESNDLRFFEDSFAWIFQGDDGKRYKTLMNASLPALDHLSNPGILFSGQPTGEAGVANNARTINQTAPFVAAYSDATFQFEGEGLSQASGSPGGGFGRSEFVLRGVNGFSSLDFKVTHEAAWLEVSPQEGTLAPGENFELRVRIVKEETQTLALGTWTEEVIIEDRLGVQPSATHTIELTFGASVLSLQDQKIQFEVEAETAIAPCQNLIIQNTRATPFPVQVAVESTSAPWLLAPGLFNARSGGTEVELCLDSEVLSVLPEGTHTAILSFSSVPADWHMETEIQLIIRADDGSSTECARDGEAATGECREDENNLDASSRVASSGCSSGPHSDGDGTPLILFGWVALGRFFLRKKGPISAAPPLI